MARLRFTNELGLLLLGIFLILWGLASTIGLSFQGMNIILGVLAVIAGGLIILDR